MPAQSRTDLRSAYLYLVCLVTLVLTIFAVVSAVRSVSQLAYPDPGYYGYDVPAKEGDVSAEELDSQAERAKESQRRQAVQSLVGSGAMLLIAAPVYLYHWRRVQAEASAGRPVPQVDAATAPPE